MRKGIFGRLAVLNIRKNRDTYVPYMLTCIFCIAMLYIMLFIQGNAGIKDMAGSESVRSIMVVGIIIVVIFSFIFLLYSNSFLMKRRQREIGLYNILGMEKGHIGRVLFAETVLTSVLNLVCGISLGILLSKLSLLFLLKLTHTSVQFGFCISRSGIVTCCAVYGAVFLLTLLNNLRRVHLSRPIELLQGSSAGEREPKAKWLMAALGFTCLGIGYRIAIKTESPIDAIPMFFLAVLLVMAGTYLVFTAGSIAVLKLMRWKKSFYYKLRNFTTVSGMLYRMKQNAVGLASICILSTGVLLMLSATVCLNWGIDDVIDERSPSDITIEARWLPLEEARGVREELLERIRKEIPEENLMQELSMQMACVWEDGQLRFANPDSAADLIGTTSGVLVAIPVKDYNLTADIPAELQPGEVLAWGKNMKDSSVNIMGEEFTVKEWLSEKPMKSSYSVYAGKVMALIVTDEDFQKIDAFQREVYGTAASAPEADIWLDVPGGITEETAAMDVLRSCIADMREEGVLGEDSSVYLDTKRAVSQNLHSMSGGFLFLGILLGGVFLLGTAIIIYYKQMSEGWEDRGRFQIMRKVGMSRREVKASIHRQILMVFFLPLLVAVLHISVAFPMVKRLLLLFGMANTGLFAICTVAAILAFALVYLVIYIFTARSYYRILESRE